MNGIYKDPRVERAIKSARLRWLGDVSRNPGGQKRRGRWLDGAEGGQQKMRRTNCNALTQKRYNWQKIAEEANVHYAL